MEDFRGQHYQQPFLRVDQRSTNELINFLQIQMNRLITGELFADLQGLYHWKGLEVEGNSVIRRIQEIERQKVEIVVHRVLRAKSMPGMQSSGFATVLYPQESVFMHIQNSDGDVIKTHTLPAQQTCLHLALPEGRIDFSVPNNTPAVDVVSLSAGPYMFTIPDDYTKCCRLTYPHLKDFVDGFLCSLIPNSF